MKNNSKIQVLKFGNKSDSEMLRINLTNMVNMYGEDLLMDILKEKAQNHSDPIADEDKNLDFSNNRMPNVHISNFLALLGEEKVTKALQEFVPGLQKTKIKKRKV